ncbi:helix-turn-helix domain-containing protein [Catalinimonas niigatensis]|uniref:helix-turn-helix domain-containing protein n=1 Tax=Catalinimonas niigatensis TaxID=1397264 RepID=UPI002666DFB8|nr:helix-turn-helix transcriptional regulator [Catalinimonas niigatensis]WPP51778.1 helix-turn-helix transcriptional regulator [Catalinimonas niigatensis]
MSEDQKSVHEKFNEVFKALGTNAYQVSKRLGLSRADKYYKIEKGQAKPSFETLSEIIHLYPRVNANYYFKDDVPMFEEGSEIYSTQPNSIQSLRIKHLEQKIAMLEAQNQELIQQLETYQKE